MSPVLPKPYFNNAHSAFSLIDPETSAFHRKFDRHGYLSSGLRTHIAISYVWSEWRVQPTDSLPSWTALRSRLSSLLGPTARPGLKAETLGASRCWIDCMCIDQNAENDKVYWIPRMDEVYSEARCTILLLRATGLDLGPLLQIQREMKCDFKGRLRLRDIRFMAPHACILSQSCTTLGPMAPELDSAALDSLRTLSRGTWRRRAWILQEILLSHNYLISWNDEGDWLPLGDAGVIAGLLFRRHPEEAWAGEFASWCRRLWYLRQNYGEAQSYELCDANVLQLSAALEATVPSDKYYALCGIMRLKDVVPDRSHSAEQALHTVIARLTREGRLSWLYAVPPAVTGRPMEIGDGRMAPFVLTRLEGRIRANRSCNASIGPSTVSFDAVPDGAVSKVEPLREVLQTTFAHVRQTRDFLFPAHMAHCALVPDIVRRLSLEMVEPLLGEPLFGQLCRTLQFDQEVRSESRKGWLCVMFLSFVDDALVRDMCEGQNAEALQVVQAAAWSLQTHLHRIQDKFSVLFWENGDSRTSTNVAIGLTGCPVGATVFSLKGDGDLMFAASPASDDVRSATFHCPVFRLNVRETIGPRPSKPLTAQFWKRRQRLSGLQNLAFQYRNSSV